MGNGGQYLRGSGEFIGVARNLYLIAKDATVGTATMRQEKRHN
jgi:hypothetical protein